MLKDKRKATKGALNLHLSSQFRCKTGTAEVVTASCVVMLSSNLEEPQEGEESTQRHLQTAASVNPALDVFPLETTVRKALNARRG